MLYIVSNPIGNLEDITLRALKVLSKVDLILAEDTRKARILLSRYKIKKPALSFYDYNKEKRLKKVLSLLEGDREIALISEAGTPGISDPAYFLVKHCVEGNIPFTALPGPTAAVNALILSGLPTDSFYFAGFLPPRKGKRRKRMRELSFVNTTLIFFESPHRIVSTFEDIKEYFAHKKMAVVREMTKIYEEVVRGEPLSIQNIIQKKPLKGEYVIVIDNRRRREEGEKGSFGCLQERADKNKE